LLMGKGTASHSADCNLDHMRNVPEGRPADMKREMR
jgi:hypothetical protein